jgi:hypothetical protein
MKRKGYGPEMTTMRRWSMIVVTAVWVGGCGTPDASVVDAGPNSGATILVDAPVLLDPAAPACSKPHTVCMTIRMPDSIPGPPTHIAIGYFTAVPVSSSPNVYGVLPSPPLVAGQEFRLQAQDGGITGDFYPVVALFMPGGGDLIPVDKLDYIAAVTQPYHFAGAPLNVEELLKLTNGL